MSSGWMAGSARAKLDTRGTMRIAVVGSPCSGKSTLATELRGAVGLDLIRLDDLYWGPRWSRPEEAEWRARLADALRGDSWIVDGNYAASFGERFARADLVIYVKTPALVCLARYAARVARIARGDTSLLPRDVGDARPWAPGDWRALPEKILAFQAQIEPAILREAGHAACELWTVTSKGERMDAVARVRRRTVQ